MKVCVTESLVLTVVRYCVYRRDRDRKDSGKSRGGGVMICVAKRLRMHGATCLVFTFLLVVKVNCVTFSERELAIALHEHGLGDELNNWHCLVMSESSGKTSVVGPPNSDGSRDWGLFQINDRYWCQGSYSGSKNVCKVNCEDLNKSNGDISKAVECAKQVYRSHGFDGWMGWQSKCKGKRLNDVTHYVRGAGCGGRYLEL